MAHSFSHAPRVAVATLGLWLSARVLSCSTACEVSSSDTQSTSTPSHAIPRAGQGMPEDERDAWKARVKRWRTAALRALNVYEITLGENDADLKSLPKNAHVVVHVPLDKELPDEKERLAAAETAIQEQGRGESWQKLAAWAGVGLMGSGLTVYMLKKARQKGPDADFVRFSLRVLQAEPRLAARLGSPLRMVGEFEGRASTNLVDGVYAIKGPDKHMALVSLQGEWTKAAGAWEWDRMHVVLPDALTQPGDPPAVYDGPIPLHWKPGTTMRIMDGRSAVERSLQFSPRDSSERS